MGEPLALRSRRVLGPRGVGPATVVVRAGRVDDVLPFDTGGALRDAEVVDLAADEVLIPGLVDTHVHLNDPGRSHWEGFDTGTRAAAAGGVTTVVDMPLNCLPPTTSLSALEVKRARADGRCLVDVGFWAGAVPSSLGGLAALAAAGVVGFKCFLLDSGVPEFPPLSGSQLLQAAQEIAAFDGLLIVHAEDAHVIDAHRTSASVQYSTYLDSRPPAAETTAIDMVIDVARRTGCRMHVVHLSASEALPSIVGARASGLRLTVETCPHYLTLAAGDVADGQTQFKCCPPVREAANADELWSALGRGEIDLVVSDHSPAPPDLKLFDTGDFTHAWGGIASVQVGLPLVWTEARRRGFRLEDVVSWMARRPADLLGWGDRGRIEPGASADFAVFAPDHAWTIEARHLHQRHALTPYEGRAVTGQVRATYLAGAPIELDGTPRGRLLR